MLRKCPTYGEPLIDIVDRRDAQAAAAAPGQPRHWLEALGDLALATVAVHLEKERLEPDAARVLVEAGRLHIGAERIAKGELVLDVRLIDELLKRLVGAPVRVGVLQNFDAVAPRSCRLAGIFDALGDPNAAAIVERHGDGIDDVGFAGDEVDAETFGQRDPLERFLRRKRLVGRYILTVRNHFLAGRDCERGPCNRRRKQQSH